MIFGAEDPSMPSSAMGGSLVTFDTADPENV